MDRMPTLEEQPPSPYLGMTKEQAAAQPAPNDTQTFTPGDNSFTRGSRSEPWGPGILNRPRSVSGIGVF